MENKIIIIILYIILGTASGYMFAFLWEKSTSKIGHLAHQKGFHFHHSLFGPFAVLLIPFVWDDLFKVLPIVFFALGVILEHTLKEGIIFISKD